MTFRWLYDYFFPDKIPPNEAFSRYGSLNDEKQLTKADLEKLQKNEEKKYLAKLNADYKVIKDCMIYFNTNPGVKAINTMLEQLKSIEEQKAWVDSNQKTVRLFMDYYTQLKHHQKNIDASLKCNSQLSNNQMHCEYIDFKHYYYNFRLRTHDQFCSLAICAASLREFLPKEETNSLEVRCNM